MRLRLESRPEPSRLATWLSPLVATFAVLAIGFVLFAAMGRDPWFALYTFFIDPIDTRYDVGELLLKATPLMLCAVGLAVGYRANVWNIGAEGQLIMGAIAGGGVALAFHGSESGFDGHHGFSHKELAGILTENGFCSCESHTFFRDTKKKEGGDVPYSLFLMSGTACC